MVSVKTKKGIVFGCGSVLLLIGIVFWPLWGWLYYKMLQEELILTNSSRSYRMWVDIPLPIYMEFHMLNWTNVEDVFSGKTTKLNFVEMGPYVFREYHHRDSILFNNNNNTVTYKQKRTWQFEPDMSRGSLEDTVTNINMVAATVAYSTRFSEGFVQIFANSLLEATHSGLTVTKTVRELLFEGYDDELLSIMRETHFSNIPFKRFGYFVERNGSLDYDGVFNMDTGTSELSHLGLIKEWNYRNATQKFASPCDAVKGSSGDLWPPVRGNTDDLYIFSPDVCLGIRLSLNGTQEAHGLNGAMYHGTPLTFDTGVLDNKTECQCVGDCQPYGTLNTSSCRFGSPLFMSFPHFFEADPWYLQYMTGLKPDSELHEFRILLEPSTGMPLQVRARMQLNILVEKYPHMKSFAGLPAERLFVPVLWFSQSADLTEDLSSELRGIVRLRAVGFGAGLGVGALGLLVAFVGAALTLRRAWSGARGSDDAVPGDTVAPTSPLIVPDARDTAAGE